MNRLFVLAMWLSMTMTSGFWLSAQEHWPEFRGINGTGHAQADLPIDLSANATNANLKWKTRIRGKGWVFSGCLGGPDMAHDGDAGR